MASPSQKTIVIIFLPGWLTFSFDLILFALIELCFKYCSVGKENLPEKEFRFLIAYN